MLASNKSICKFNRKIKREYSVYDINNKKEKDSKTERHKLLNMKKSIRWSRIMEWNISKTIWKWTRNYWKQYAS